jgi:SAM-dependent methyltransferase
MTLRERLVRQFHRPSGVGGSLAGIVMGHRGSNVARNRWAAGLLAPLPGERVLELGCGPGVALAALAAAGPDLAVGVDHSDVMVRQASRRNRDAVASGRVRVVRAAVQDLAPGVPPCDEPFDAALAVNVPAFGAGDAAERLAGVRRLLRPGGRIALVAQPRNAGASADDSRQAADRLSGLLGEAGYADVEVDTLELDPPAVCVRAVSPPSAGTSPPSGR